MSENVILAEGVEAPLEVSESAEVVGGGTPPLPVKVAAAVQAVETDLIALDQIEVDPDDQIRIKGLFEYRILSMMEALENGQDLGEITLYRLGGRLKLADGFHRVESFKRLKRAFIKAVIRQGDELDLALGAGSGNLGHGLELSFDDKKKLYRMLWQQNPTLGQMAKNGFSIGKWSPDLRWREVSGRGGKSNILGIAKSTENGWAQEIAESFRITHVFSANGKQMDVQKLQAASEQAKAAAEERLKAKIRRAVANGKLTNWEADNLKIEEYSANPNDLWLWLHSPTRGKVKIDGHYQRPADIELDKRRAVKLAEERVNEAPASERVESLESHVIVIKGDDWQPKTLENLKQGESAVYDAAVVNSHSVANYTKVSAEYEELALVAVQLEQKLEDFDAAFEAARLVRSVRSLQEVDIWKAGMMGTLTKTLEAIKRFQLHEETVIDLMRQLDEGWEGQDG